MTEASNSKHQVQTRDSTECRQCLFFDMHLHPNNSLYGSCKKGNWDKTGKREFRVETVTINENRLIVARGRDCADYRPLAKVLLGRKLYHIAEHWDEDIYGDVHAYLHREG
jgi:hypothetical protein